MVNYLRGTGRFWHVSDPLIVDADRDKIAATQLAVHGEIEQGQLTRTAFQLQPGSNGPHMTQPQWRLRGGELALVPHRSGPSRTW